MTVILNQEMPVFTHLQKAGVRVLAQDAVPAGTNAKKVGILNLMPNKEETEAQILWHLAASDEPVYVEFIAVSSYQPKHTSPDYLRKFYHSFDQAAGKLDGLIITGAPLEHMDFSQVRYWRELADIMDYAAEHISATLFLCWAVPAALWHRYGIPMRLSVEKLSGVFPHRIIEPTPLFNGLREPLSFPHSRYFYLLPDALAKTDLLVLAGSAETGISIAASPLGKDVYITGHLEYSRDTLQKEYRRDLARGLPITMPAHYFPADNPANEPAWTWRELASRFYCNWLDHCVKGRP